MRAPREFQMNNINEIEISKTLFDVIRIRATNNLDTSAEQINRLIQSAANKSIHLIHNEAGFPIGYVAWAKISRDTLNLAAKMNRLPALPYEWFDGNIKLIFDLTISKDWATLARYHLFLFLRKHRFFSYYRNNKLTICQHRHPRHNGYFWQYKKLNPLRIKLIKSN